MDFGMASPTKEKVHCRPASDTPFCYFGFPSLSDSGLYCANSLLECPVHLDAVHQSMGSAPFRFDGRYNYYYPTGAWPLFHVA